MVTVSVLFWNNKKDDAIYCINKEYFLVIQCSMFCIASFFVYGADPVFERKRKREKLQLFPVEKGEETRINVHTGWKNAQFIG